MSPKSFRLNSVEVLKILKSNDFIEISQAGSHLKLFNEESRRTTIVPFHKGKNLPIGTLKSIEKQSGLKFL